MGQFDDYKRLLAGEKINFDINEPTSGYFRTRRYKDGPLVPVAIWCDDDGVNVLCDGKPVELEKVWPHCARNPIPYVTYMARMETGKWPDIDPVAHDQAENARAVTGGNNPPEDPAEILAEQIASARAGTSVYKNIQDDETLAKAQTLRSRLLELHGQADKHREALKRPHLDENTKIDAKWQPIVKSAKAGADELRTEMETFETKKLQKRRAEEAVAAAAQRAHDEAVAKAAREAAEAGKPAPAPPPPPPPPPPMPMAAPIKGAAGRAASSKPKIKVKSIKDLDALFNYMRLRPEVSDLLMILAQKAIDAGRTDVPGIITEEVAKVV